MPDSPLAIVTGGTRGIGAAVSEALLQQGWTVYACFLRNRKAAEATARALQPLPGTYHTVKANIAKAADLTMLVESVVKEHGGPIKGLVLNAASGVLKPLSENTRKHWDWTMDINVWGHVRLAQLARPHMTEGSSIVAISSPGAVSAIPNYGAVGASKAALEAVVRQLAYEWGPGGVRANTVRAGLVPTDALDHFPEREQMERTALRESPLGRLVQPHDVAGAVHYLLSDAAAAVTGETLNIDAGARLRF